MEGREKEWNKWEEERQGKERKNESSIKREDKRRGMDAKVEQKKDWREGEEGCEL